jgi:Icc-related predicted phosphoesterase
MKIIVIGDIHNNLNLVKQMRDDLVEADLILLTGSITVYGDRVDGERVIGQLRLINPNLLAVIGRLDNESVLEYIESEGISLHGMAKVIGNLGIYGVGGGRISLFRNPSEFSEREFSELLAEAYNHVKDCKYTILLSHTPPINTNLDKTVMGEHIGSKAIRSFIFKHPPNILLSNQMQGMLEKDRFGITNIISPGSLESGGYLLIDFSDGFNILFKNIFSTISDKDATT